MKLTCEEAQAKLRDARERKDRAAAWDISNTMRAHGCTPSLSGLKRSRCGWVLGWSARGRAAGAITVSYTCNPKGKKLYTTRTAAGKAARKKAKSYGTSVRFRKRGSKRR